MKNIINKFLLIALSTFAINAMAQKHEISVYGGGGISSLNQETNIITQSDTKNKAGLLFGVNYGFNITPGLTILTGAEIASYKAEYSLNRILSKYNTIDSEGDDVEFNFTMQGYKENATATYLNIPIMVRYTHPVSDKLGIYAAGGGKIGLAMSGSYKNSYSELTTFGAYPQWGQSGNPPLITDEPDQGFGSFANGSYDGDAGFKMAYMASAELGVKYNISEKYDLYFGGYFDYSLNNVYKEEQATKQIIEYNGAAPSNFIGNSAINSSFGESKTPFLKSIHPMSIGVKIRFSYKL